MALTLIACDGFETGDFSRWTNINTLEDIVPSRSTSHGTKAYASLSTLTTQYIDCYQYQGSSNANAKLFAYWVQLREAASAGTFSSVEARDASDARVLFISAVAGTTNTISFSDSVTSVGSFSTGQGLGEGVSDGNWHLIEVWWEESASGAYVVWFDGRQRLSGTANFKNGGVGNTARLFLGTTTGRYPNYDDIVFCEATSPADVPHNYDIFLTTGSTSDNYYFDESNGTTAGWTQSSRFTSGFLITSVYAYLVAPTEATLSAYGVGAPSSGATISSVDVSLHVGQSASGNYTYDLVVYTEGQAETLLTQLDIACPLGPVWSSWYTLSAPTGGWTYADVQKLEIAVTANYVTGSGNIEMYAARVRVNTSATGGTTGGDALDAGTWQNVQEAPYDDSNTAQYTAPAGTTTERQPPDTIATQTNLTGSVTDIDDDPDSPDANWLDATSSSTLRVTFPTPTAAPATGAGLQEFRVLMRKSATGPTPSVEDVVPDSLTSMTNYTGSAADIDDDPDSPDGTFVYTTSPYDDPSMNINFTNPTNGGTINTDSGSQTIEFYLDKASDGDPDGTTGGGDPTFSAAIYDSGGLHETIATDVTVTGPAKFSYTWTASGLSSPNDVYIVFTTASNGGGPNTRHVIVDACRWLMAYGAGETQPGYQIKLYENGSEVVAAGSASGNITDAGGDTVVSFTWDATNLGTADGSLVECYVNQTSGSNRYIDIGAVEWNAQYNNNSAPDSGWIQADGGGTWEGPSGVTNSLGQSMVSIGGLETFIRTSYSGGSTLTHSLWRGNSVDGASEYSLGNATASASNYFIVDSSTSVVPAPSEYTRVGFGRPGGTDANIVCYDVIGMVVAFPPPLGPPYLGRRKRRNDMRTLINL